MVQVKTNPVTEQQMETLNPNKIKNKEIVTLFQFTDSGKEGNHQIYITTICQLNTN